MPKIAAVGIVLLFGTGCATQHVPLQAALLPPVDGKMALWVNQPSYFAVVGVGPERGAEVLYQQTALEAVPSNGFISVPTHPEAVAAPEMAEPDADYEQVYLVASPTPIDVSALPSAERDVDPARAPQDRSAVVQRLLASSAVVDGYKNGYKFADTVDRIVCYNRAIFGSLGGTIRYLYDPYYTEVIHPVLCSQHLRRSVRTMTIATRTFFTPMPKLHPPGKGEPPRIPPGIQLARAGLVQTSPGNWSRANTSVDYAAHNTTTSFRTAPTTASYRTASTTSTASTSSSSSSPSSSAPSRPH